MEAVLSGTDDELPDGSFDALLERAGLSVTATEVLRLLYQKGLSAADAARRRHTSRQNIYQNHCQALRKVRRALQPIEPASAFRSRIAGDVQLVLFKPAEL